MADEEEKTEEPTGKRLSDARAEGNVAKSAEISGAAILTFGTVYLLFFSSFSLIEIKKLMIFSYSFIGQELDGPLFYAITNHIVMTLIKALAPLFNLLIVSTMAPNRGVSLPSPPERTAKWFSLDMINVDWNMLVAKDILPAAAPLGSFPVGSVMITMLQVAAEVLINNARVTRSTRIFCNLFRFILVSP